MYILPVSMQSRNNSRAKSLFANKQEQSFRARLLVHSSAKKVGLAKLESRYVWDEIVDLFKRKLRNDPVKPNDLVELKGFPSNKRAKSIYTGKERAREFEYPSYDAAGCGHYRKGITREAIFEDEDLEVCINKSSEGFMLNANNSAEEVADDLYNTYKRVRYKEHFDK